MTKPTKAEPEPEEAEEEKQATKSKKKKATGLAVGDKVTFVDDEGLDKEGVISAIEDGAYTVITGTGKKAEEWELEDPLRRVFCSLKNFFGTSHGWGCSLIYLTYQLTGEIK